MNEERIISGQALSCFDNLPVEEERGEMSEAGELRPGQVFDGRFAIVGVVSRGGMAVVYQARDTHDHDCLVALKMPHVRFESDPVFFRRFEREEEIGRKLNHPYVLKFKPVEKKSRPYIVTEFLRGCTLSHLIYQKRVLPEIDALKIASLVCEALQHMHWRGVLHRDLKPGNIMVCADRTIRIMDFGIATAAAVRRLTIAGSAPLGTPEYMAPEQVRNKRTDERTDVYSLGAILYEMLTGVVPFENENPWISMNNRVTADPIAPRKLNPDLSPQAEEIVLHAMQRDPAGRFQSAAAFKVALDAPDQVTVTGLRDRLEEPHWRIGLRETPFIAGTLISIGFVLSLVALFFVLRHFFTH